MESAYLQSLVVVFVLFFFFFVVLLLLFVFVVDIDWVENERDYAELVERIRRTRSGRHYVNPLPAELLS